MTVNPGFGGQAFIPAVLSKVKEVKTLSEQKGLTDLLIEIDGGVTLQNIEQLIAAGADVLVAGNTVFSSPDPQETIKRLKAAGK